MSLAESLIVVAIGVLLVGVVYKLLMSATQRGEEMTEEVKLLVDVRSLVEHMSRDVAAAHVILPPEAGGDFKTSLTLARYAAEDASDRMESNSANPVYPFFEPNSTVPLKLKLNRVNYTFDRARREVTRLEEKGVLEGRPVLPTGVTKQDLRVITEYTFTAESAVPGGAGLKGPAKLISRFDFAYMFYDDKGQPKLAASANEVYRTSCVSLNLKATQDTNLYAREAGKTPSRRQPTVELATKFWSQRRLSEIMYPEYFSSADDDLRF